MEISILVCDDLSEARSDVIAMLRTYESEHDVEFEIDTAANGAELLNKWRPGRWALIFLDIYMPELDGIQAARKLRSVDPDCEIVMVTTSRDHGIEAYELRALDYLCKPFTQDDVDSVMDWFLKQRSEHHRELVVRAQWCDQSIRLDDICYIESRGHRCAIHMKDKEIIVRKSVEELSADIGEAGFYRCHQSFLVNFTHVTQVEKRTFLLDNGARVPISSSNLAQSKAALLEWVALQNR